MMISEIEKKIKEVVAFKPKDQKSFEEFRINFLCK